MMKNRFIDTAGWTRLREVDAYAEREGISRGQAVKQLVHHALSIGPNPYHDMLRGYAARHALTEDEAYAQLWGENGEAPELPYVPPEGIAIVTPEEYIERTPERRAYEARG